MPSTKPPKPSALDAAINRIAAALEERLQGSLDSESWITKKMTQWGPVLVTMMILLLVVLGWLPSNLMHQADGEVIAKLLHEHQEAMVKQSEKQSQANLEQAKLLRSICRSIAEVAKNPAARENCDR